MFDMSIYEIKWSSLCTNAELCIIVQNNSAYGSNVYEVGIALEGVRKETWKILNLT